MVSPLFFYQLVLVALVWRCLMLQWAWPSDPATACPTTQEPPPPRPKRQREPKPFAGLTTKPHCDACVQVSDPRPHAPSAPPPRIVMTRGRRRQIDTSRHCCPNPDCAYRGWVGWGNLRANGHPNGGPWRQLLALPAAAICSRPSARSFMARALLSTSSCRSSPAWPRDWASAAPRGCSRWTPIRCCSGWSKQPSSGAPSPSTSCTMYGSARCQLDELFALLSAVKAGEGQRGRGDRAPGAVAPVGGGRDGPGEQAAARARRRPSDPGIGPALCPPRRAALGARLRPPVSHGWLSRVPDGLADA